MLTLLPSRWYVANVTRREILNCPTRRLADALGLLRLDEPAVNLGDGSYVAGDYLVARGSWLLARRDPYGRFEIVEPDLEESFTRCVPRCRKCGCTDDDCEDCIERTGQPCHWVESDLCSACVPPVDAVRYPRRKRTS